MAMRKRFILVFIVALNVFFIVYLTLFPNKRFPDYIPKLEIGTQSGEVYNLRDRSRLKLLFFLEAEDSISMDAMLRSSEYLRMKGITNIDLIVFSSNPELVEIRTRQFQFIYVAEQAQYKRYWRPGKSQYYFYDTNGRLLGQGYTGNTIFKLISLMNRPTDTLSDTWQASEFVSRNENVSSNTYLSFLLNYAENEKEGRCAFIFLDDACGNCLFGRVIRDLDKIRVNNSQLAFYIVLPRTLTENDLSNLQNNERLKLRLIHASEKAEAYREVMLQDRFMSTTNGLVLILSSSGAIVYSTDFIDELDRLDERGYEETKDRLAK